MNVNHGVIDTSGLGVQPGQAKTENSGKGFSLFDEVPSAASQESSRDTEQENHSKFATQDSLSQMQLSQHIQEQFPNKGVDSDLFSASGLDNLSSLNVKKAPVETPLIDKLVSHIFEESVESINDYFFLEIKGGVSAPSLFESSAGTHSSGNAVQSQTLLPIRLIPLGSLGNGYLSNLAYSDISLHTDQATERPGQQISSQELAPSKPLVGGIQAGSLASSGEQKAEGILVNKWVMSTLKSVMSEATKLTSAVMPNVSDIAKRYLLMTPNNDGVTLWYRDYELAESDKQNMRDRLDTSEFLKENNVRKVFVNGELFWKGIGESKND